jgi:uncharacterized membrane protein
MCSQRGAPSGILSAGCSWDVVGEEVAVAREGLTTLVVGYDDVTAARGDYEDLAAARQEHRVGDYEAVVVCKTESGHKLLATTVDPRVRWTLRTAGLGCVVGAVLAPALAGALLGAGIGAIAGDLVDRIDAFNHADMQEVNRLVDDSTANIIVVCDAATAAVIAEVARSRGRVVLPFSSADVDLLKREVQRNQPSSGLA